MDIWTIAGDIEFEENPLNCFYFKLLNNNCDPTTIIIVFALKLYIDLKIGNAAKIVGFYFIYKTNRAQGIGVTLLANF